ncbi:hypothetical protein [Erwinia amylovora]
MPIVLPQNRQAHRAVSSTHLDVYKRQEPVYFGPERWTCCSFLIQALLSFIHIMPIVLPQNRQAHRAVSSTHLDVYKRQPS